MYRFYVISDVEEGLNNSCRFKRGTRPPSRYSLNKYMQSYIACTMAGQTAINYKNVNNNLLSLMISIGTHTVWITIFLSPKAFDDTAIDFRIMRRFDGVRRCFLSCKLNKSISLVLEHSYVLDGAKRRECFLYQLVCDTVCKTTAIYSAIGRTTLVINLSKTTNLA